MSKSSRKQLEQPINTNHLALNASAKRIFLSSDKSTRKVVSHPHAISLNLKTRNEAGRGSASNLFGGDFSDCLIIPIRNIATNKVQGAQCIGPEGETRMCGTVADGVLIVGDANNLDDPWLIMAEWESLTSELVRREHQVAVCSFGENNQERVAKMVAEIYRPLDISILKRGAH